MGKPKKKLKDQKNKSKMGDKIFEKIEATAFDFEESTLTFVPKMKINNLLHMNYSPSICEWTSQKAYKEVIYNYINEKNADFLTILETGIQFGWNFKQIDEKLDALKQNRFLTATEKKFQTLITQDLKTCIICQEEKKEFFALECAHEFCLDCYKNYLKSLLNENGPSIVKKTCPMQECKVKKFYYKYCKFYKR